MAVEGASHGMFSDAEPATAAERRAAVVIVMASAALFLVCLPFAKVELAVVPAFIPAYETALIVTDLVTAILLLGQFVRFRSRAILALAAGYFFDALIIVFHFLSYPGVFSETGLLGSGPQTTAWLYIAWHGGFPLFVIAYALLRERDAMAGERPPARLALSVGLAVTLAAALVTLASTAGHDALPALMSDNRYTPSAIFFLGGAWVLSMLALVMLWWRGVRSLLDVWVVVVMFAWVFDIGLSAVLNGGRYDLGFYAGRLYGLFAASIVMSVILFETSGLYSRLASTADRLRRQVRETETRQELVEAQLRQAQKMEAIGNLTGGMAHDFNNLLAVIIGNLDILLEKRPFDPDIKELGGEALDAGLRGADLTRRLLAFARRQPLQPKEVQLNDLIAGITRLLSRTLGENVEVSLDLDPKLWPVIVDPAQLDACLANLATNARDAMPSGGSLVIVSANRHLDEDYAAEHGELAAGDYSMIEVTDTGSGMAPETMAHIFEPFFTTKELGRGTGLGLSMVYGFMKQSGGHINVYSEPGIGTTFRLYLPRAPHVAAGVVPSPATDTLQGRGETILTVEDNASLRRVVVRQLRELGYKVLEAEHAAAAMQVLEQEKVDLLFTDVVMAGMSGLELAAVVRQRWPGMRIVVTSGFPEAHVGANGNGNGNGHVNGRHAASVSADGTGVAPTPRLLNKPYRKEDLARILRKELEGG